MMRKSTWSGFSGDKTLNREADQSFGVFPYVNFFAEDPGGFRPKTFWFRNLEPESF
jgi:hypothetical protein